MKRLILILAATIVALNGFTQTTERISSKGYALYTADGELKSYDFTRHPIGKNDILIENLYCGVCHSDIHQGRGDWSPQSYPLVVGHEIVGRVTQVGSNVTKFKVGDYAGVGCMVGSCRHCEYCDTGEEQYCLHGRVLTYGDKDLYHGNEISQGGYSNNMVVDEHFAVTIPEGADIEKVGPLMCAGVTTYSPIMHAGIKRGDKVGVAGFGGLGHMAVQYTVALGAEVTVFDITDEKRDEALAMGAVRYVNVRNYKELEGLNNTFSFILSTIPSAYDPMLYVNMLKVDGDLAIVGMPAAKDAPVVSALGLRGRRKVWFSVIGGMRETQETVNYSVSHGIYPQVEVIPIQQINEAWKNVVDGKVHFRYVIDMKSLK